jgi:ribosomal protein S27E
MGVDAEMFARTMTPITEDQLKELRWRIGDTFDCAFWIFDDPRNIYPGDTKPYYRHSLELVNMISQDGPDILPKEGETFLKVNLQTRYYGPGYERGNFMLIYSVARWLEKNVPGAEVWYGGDSSGVTHKLFDATAREEMFEYFISNGHEPYNSYFKDSFEKSGTPRCPNKGCIGKTIAYGGGPKYSSSYCHSCGRTIWTHDGGETWFSGRPSDSALFADQGESADYVMKDGKNWEVKERS